MEIDPRMPLTVPNLHYGNDDRKQPIFNINTFTYPSMRILRNYLPPAEIKIKREQLQEKPKEEPLPENW
jgi:hypothetical protein